MQVGRVSICRLMNFKRIRLYRIAILCCIAVLIVALVHASDAKPGVSPDSAWELLQAGNSRFVAGRLAHPDQTVVRRKEVAQGQHPFALVLTCADSRVSPELYFDQGLGDLFVVRNAGNVIDDHVIGSIEYAVEHLGVSLVIVVGHTKCGAVSAAVAGGDAPGHIGSIVKSIEPAVRAAAEKSGDPVDNAVTANAALMAAALRKSNPILAEAVEHGALRVEAAKYDLVTGRVELIEPEAEK